MDVTRNARPLATGFALVLLVALALVAASTAHADLLSLWRLDETSGTVAPNSVAGGFDGTLVNGPQWFADADRAQVISFNGSNYVDLVGIPAIRVVDDFTVSFWARSEQGVNSDVILGNRFAGPDNSWIKFTPNQFEYVVSYGQQGINYSDIPANQWIHHAVVKDGADMTYYRNGVAGGTNTATADMPALPAYLGGDAAGEQWQGKLDNVAIFDHPLTPAELQNTISGFFAPFTATPAAAMSDSFDGPGLDTTKWEPINQGLESKVGGGYDEPTIAGGTVTLGGSSTHSYWAGKSIASTNSFDVPTDGELRFDVDRVSLAGSGTAYRSSMWMYVDDTQFHHFSQITPNGWSYNAGNNNPIGNGVDLARLNSLDSDMGGHKMTLSHDGAYVKMFLDGRWVGSQAANFTDDIHVLLTGQARAATDTVAAEFDNASVTTRTFAGMYDDFNAPTIDTTKWTVLNKGLENSGPLSGSLAASIENGELTIEGDTGAQYWYGVTLESTRVDNLASPAAPLVYEIDRDALTGSGSAYRSSLWMYYDDTHFIHFSQNVGETGWQYNNSGGGGGTAIGAFNAVANDNGHHVMKLVHDGSSITPYLDDVAGPNIPVSWNTGIQMLVTGQSRAIGDTVQAAFDNARIAYGEGTMTPPDTSPDSFDDFQDGTIDPAKWNVIEKGLQLQGPGTGTDVAAQEVGGRILLSGTANTSYWGGRSLQTTDRFIASPAEPLVFEVDREFLNGIGSAFRSSLWMWADDSRYLHFSQNVGETGWQYNSTDQGSSTGGGTGVGAFNAAAPDLGNHQMQLVHDGTSIQLFLDGQPGPTVPVAWAGGIHMILTGQARATGDQVAAVFDNARIYHTQGALTPPDTSPNSFDDFQDGTLDASKWTVIEKGLETQGAGTATAINANEAGGRLSIMGTANTSYWAGTTAQTVPQFMATPAEPLVFEVDREFLASDSAGRPRSSLWMWLDDTHYLHFAQNPAENGWQYNSTDQGTPDDRGTTVAAFNAAAGDLGNHQMRLVHNGTSIQLFLDGQPGPVVPAAWAGGIHMMLTGQARAAGDQVAAVFDNTRIYRESAPTTPPDTSPFSYDDFQGASIDPAKWNVLVKGLEKQGGNTNGTIAAKTASGRLAIEGIANTSYWGGTSLQSTQSWDASSGLPLMFEVDREFITGWGTAQRSSLWMWVDDSHFLSFAYNRGESGWQFNSTDLGNPTGGGTGMAALNALFDAFTDDQFHTMKLIHDGSEISIFLDDVLGATVPVSWNTDIHMLLSGMARASGDGTSVLFDNARVRIIPEPATLSLLGAALVALARRRKR